MPSESIITYAQEMLDPFTKRPFNNVDAAILAQLSYAQLAHERVPQVESTRAAYDQLIHSKNSRSLLQRGKNYIRSFSHKDSQKLSLPDEQRFVSLYTAFWRKEDFESIFPSAANRASMIELVSAVLASPRFRDIQVGEFAYEFNDERYNDQQFAAMTFLLPDGTEFISLRGTETTFVGWREDFELAFHKEIPSQISAMTYLQDMHKHSGGRKMIVAGHSKGGNTAVYAASTVPPHVQDSLTAVYSFDGPGFITNLLDTEGYKRIEDRIVKLIPQDSFVGMMFEGREPYAVVHSSAASFSQHFLFNWDIDMDSADFVYDDQLTDNALKIANSYVEWTNSLDLDTRRKVIDGVFKIFESTGYSSFTEIADNITSAAPVMWEAAQNTPAEDRDVTVTAFRELFSLIFGFNKSVLQWDSFLDKLPFSFKQDNQLRDSHE
ncbi:Mbeg1-like protein [Alloscardovia omnicolens]|uniref:Mbeg1-like protein n=1 Tax=Alloscardovia omnicolens TaxID=419015 RepID=UPI003A6269E8